MTSRMTPSRPAVADAGNQKDQHEDDTAPSHALLHDSVKKARDPPKVTCPSLGGAFPNPGYALTRMNNCRMSINLFLFSDKSRWY